MAELQIQIGANVNSAIKGLNQVQAELLDTGKSATAMGNTVSQATNQLSKLPQSANQATTAVGNLSRIVQDAPFGFIAISNNLQPLFDNFTQLKQSTGSVGGALKGLGSAIIGPAGIGLAFAAATSLVTVFSKELFGTGKAAEKAKSDADKLRDSINGVFSETAKEATSAASLVAVLKNETETRERKLAAIQELQSIQPEIFNGLKLEGDAVLGLDQAYTAYLDNLKNVLAAKIKQAQLEQLIEKQLKQQGVTLVGNEKLLVEGTRKLQESLANDPRLGPEAGRVLKYYKDQERASQTTSQRLQSDIDGLIKDITELSKGVEIPPLKAPKVDKAKLDLAQFLEAEEIEFPLRFSDDPTEIKNRISPVAVEIENQIKAAFTRIEPLDGSLLIALEEEKSTQKFANYIKLVEGFTERINSTLNNIQIDSLANIGETIGAALGGGDIKNSFVAFGEIIASGLQTIGKYLIEFGVLAKAVKVSLSQLFKNPVVAIATGIGLIAAGAALKSALNAGVQARALGGPVSGGQPYLVGERGPELFVPQVSGGIVPNNQVGSMMNGRSTDSGRGSVLRGQDIILAYARTQRSQLRVNG